MPLPPVNPIPLLGPHDDLLNAEVQPDAKDEPIDRTSALVQRDDRYEALERKARADKIATETPDEPVVTRRELWAYYMFFSGDNGQGPLVYSLTLFQALTNSAGYDPTQGPGVACDPGGDGPCVVPWGGGEKDADSVVLIANGLSFLFLTLIITTLSPAADYGSLARWLLLITTVVCWAAQFGSMGLLGPAQWQASMVVYIVSFVSYGATLVFYAALFPRLARHTPHTKVLREKYERGEISDEEYDREESLEKNRISNISTVIGNVGDMVTFLLALALLIPLADNPLVDNYTIVLTNGYWVITGIAWFIFQQRRPGPPKPKGQSYLTLGWRQLWATCKHYRRLPFTFIYLFSFFLLADALNTTSTLVSIIQNDEFTFSFLQITYLGIAQGVGSISSTAAFWYIQRYWKIRTKPMFIVTNVFSILIPLWGMIGLWTQNFGFHQPWEFWAYNVIYGVFQAPYFAYSQTMMAELTPPGYDNMFFGLFGVINGASSMIGPNVIQTIINNTNNNWEGFPFVFALATAASLVIWFGVDIEKGRQDAVTFAQKERINTQDENQEMDDVSLQPSVRTNLWQAP